MKNSTVTNKVFLMGKISSNFQFSHKSNGVCYYMAKIDLQRTSGYIDRIPVMVSENIHRMPEKGSDVWIEGQFQSFNKNVDGHTKVILKVLALDIKTWDKTEEDFHKNYIFLDGYICKQPSYRETTRGRSISEVCIAVNRSFNHCDYLPCIFWGGNAKIVSSLPVGCQIKIWGRIQSRMYIKKTEKGPEERTAYEVSVSRMKYQI